MAFATKHIVHLNECGLSFSMMFKSTQQLMQAFTWHLLIFSSQRLNEETKRLNQTENKTKATVVQ